MAANGLRNWLAVKILSSIFAVVVAGLLLTFCSYIIVTGHNISLDPLKEYKTFSGPIINLPCAGGPNSSPIPWESDKPVLPESRGLPLNYRFWNPCYGNQILRKEFLVDWAFWTGVCAVLFTGYRLRNTRRGASAR